MTITDLLKQFRDWGSEWRLEIDCPTPGGNPRFRVSWTDPITDRVIYGEIVVEAVQLEEAYAGAIERELERKLRRMHDDITEELEERSAGGD